jgi:SAM-dependent methyltransferase
MNDAGTSTGLAASPPIEAHGTKGLSNPRTTAAVRALLAELDWTRARVADVGAGRGHFCAELAAELVARGLEPREHLLPCDRQPETFQARGIPCARVAPDGRLPYPDASCDAVVSIEVIEHVEDAFAFVRELARIARPGARVIVTTPNVLSLPSRLRMLVWGFPELFGPLPLSGADERLLGGHIHPIAPYYLALAALRAGLVAPRLRGDRRKRSALAWLPFLWPALALSSAFQRARLARKAPELLDDNRALLAEIGGLELLTARTAILCATKPA